MKPHLKARGTAVMVSGSDVTAVDETPNVTMLSHTGASMTARDMAAWRPVRASPDADLLPDLDALVGRARDIDRNNGVAKSGIQTVVDNVVGTGLRLSARPNWRALKQTKEWADAWSTQVEALWVDWAETTACDAADTMIFDHMTALQLRSQLMNGAHLALPLWMPQRGDGWSTKLQTLEVDRLCNPDDRIEISSKRRGGIEFDSFGAPIAYWIKTTHPGDFWYVNVLTLDYPGKWVRIPRRTPAPFNRLRVIHGYDKDRSGQSTGKPILSSVMAQFKNLDRYAQAELQAAVVNAMIAGIIETPLDHDSILQLFNNDSDKYLATRKDYAVTLEAGSLLPVFPGDKVQPFLPSRPATSFGPFMENVLRMIAVSMDLPYEMLLKDFTKTTYSSARAAMLEAWRAFSRRRDMLSTQWCDPVYELWMEEAVNAGKIDAPDFYTNKRAYLRCRWIGPGRGYVDPTKEAQAAVYRIQNNLSTLEDECAELGGKDWREVLEQRAAERKLEESLLTPAEKARRDQANKPAVPPGGGKAGAGAPPVKKPAAAVKKTATAESDEVPGVVEGLSESPA